MSRSNALTLAVISAVLFSMPSNAQSFGDAFNGKGDLEKSNALEIWKALEICAENAAADNYLGRAEGFFEAAKKYARKTGSDPNPLLHTLHQQAEFYSRLEMYGRARHLYEEAYTTHDQYYGPKARSTRPRELLDQAALFSDYSRLLAKEGKRERADKMSALATMLREEEERIAFASATAYGTTNVSGADVNWGPYMAAFQRKLKEHWSPLEKDLSAGRIVALIKVKSDGTLLCAKLYKKSAEETANRAALKAIQSAAPFGPLPDGAMAAIDIQFTFDVSEKPAWQ